MKRISLNGDWNLRYENLSWGPEKAAVVSGEKHGWMTCKVPCDVHTPLIENGIIKEPLEALYCFDCEWVEDKSWWFKKVFDVDGEIFKGDVVELTLESLDVEADIFLNGTHLGHHKSAHYPFTADVKQYLKDKENILLVRVTSGLEHYSENDINPFKKSVSMEEGRGDARRVYVRKAQYVYGWDWAPRIATCGIAKDVYIKSYEKLAIRGVHVRADSVHADQAVLAFKVEVENLHPFKSFDGMVQVELVGNGVPSLYARELFHLRSGLNFVSFKLVVTQPKLWWPNGMGDQNRYTVRVSAKADGVLTEYPAFKYGIRTLRLNTEKLNHDERLFAFEINGIKTFCKGGNWIPADGIYARVTEQKYDTLIKEAKEANFTMLRIWGGGIYERDIFYEKCDEYGILVWHDFMFACGLYPDDREWFQREVEKEMDYQTRRLRNHPCMALWCGNNENHWGFSEWWVGDNRPEFLGGATCYNRIAPSVVEKNCPNIPYWNSSPYGGDKPNGNEIGDRHHWHDCTMNPDMEKRITPQEYDKVSSKFVSEYGYIGPCAKSTIEKYHAGNPVDRNGAIWNLHNNTFEKDTVVAGIAKHYVDSQNLDLDDYILYAGLCQGLMYQYSLEAIRFKKDCWGSLFWMYNDCWGEVGWTIIDYYLMRKPSYYYVKRAFAPVKLILREMDGEVKVMGINETSEPMSFEMEYGYISFDGTTKSTLKTHVLLEPFCRDIVFKFSKGDHDFFSGVCYVKPLDSRVEPALLRLKDFRELNLPRAIIQVDSIEKLDDSIRLTVSSNTFAHAVHFNLEDSVHLSDEYFDLLPGEKRQIEIRVPSKDFDIGQIKPMCVSVK